MRDCSETSWAPPVSETVQCLHLLQKHRGSRRPASWRNPHITITKEEAIANLRGACQDTQARSAPP